MFKNLTILFALLMLALPFSATATAAAPADIAPIASVNDSDAVPAPTEFKTTYTDRNGSEHTVVTPVDGSTMAAKREALREHIALVKQLQEAFPPAPANG